MDYPKSTDPVNDQLAFRCSVRKVGIVSFEWSVAPLALCVCLHILIFSRPLHGTPLAWARFFRRFPAYFCVGRSEFPYEPYYSC